MSQERLTKITLIEDINKLNELNSGKSITVKQFDKLYDMTVDELEFYLRMLDMRYELLNIIKQ